MVVLSMTLFGYWRVKVVNIIAMDFRVKRMELCRLQSDGTGFLYISVQEALFNLQISGTYVSKSSFYSSAPGCII